MYFRISVGGERFEYHADIKNNFPGHSHENLRKVVYITLKIASHLQRKTQNTRHRQKKFDKNGKNLSFATCKFIDGNFISWRLVVRISPKL